MALKIGPQLFRVIIPVAFAMLALFKLVAGLRQLTRKGWAAKITIPLSWRLVEKGRGGNYSSVIF
jgi:hypothetical protein